MPFLAKKENRIRKKGEENEKTRATKCKRK